MFIYCSFFSMNKIAGFIRVSQHHNFKSHSVNVDLFYSELIHNSHTFHNYFVIIPHQLTTITLSLFTITSPQLLCHYSPSPKHNYFVIIHHHLTAITLSLFTITSPQLLCHHHHLEILQLKLTLEFFHLQFTIFLE